MELKLPLRCGICRNAIMDDSFRVHIPGDDFKAGKDPFPEGSYIACKVCSDILIEAGVAIDD